MPDLTLLLALTAMLLAIGAFVGVLAGMLGVGGGIVLVPAFFYAFQTLGYGGPQLMQICLATSLATIMVTSARSVLSHNRKGAVEWYVLRTWAPGIAVGAVLGVIVAAALRSGTLQVIFGVLALCVGLYLLLGRTSWRLGHVMPGTLLRTLLSPVVGFLSVLMGIGGGSFGVPLMTLHGISMHRAVATAAGFGAAIAVPSVIAFLLVDVAPQGRPPLTVGAVNLPAFVIVIAMTMLTAPVGVRLAHGMDAVLLRRVFGAFLMLIALNMLRKALGW
ncbi:sulfite exporter TauE/SafE family protein [Roseovarius dicentrarchi]|uniref:sulfite exporter TauE/SafE family protein n=1 Tax=Roseovarius dicentrarchi TaxID=2250573 RepID=UPI000DE8A591|nr:sulfite exporter TauE/SafE family protein [Roseovarius dicentrarchi]